MIIGLLGTVGSGKTVTAVKFIYQRNCKAYTNFTVKQGNAEQLKIDNVLKTKVLGIKKSGQQITDLEINWDFWNDAKKQYSGFDIYLDEVHNLVHSREAMQKKNILLSKWLSQIRKILGNTEKHHLFLISQRLGRIDLSFRDLLDTIIYNVKVQGKKRIRTEVVENGKHRYKNIPVTFIIQYIFTGENCVFKYNFFRDNPRMARNMKMYRKSVFLANPYFKYYDSYEIVRFGETVYL